MVILLLKVLPFGFCLMLQWLHGTSLQVVIMGSTRNWMLFTSRNLIITVIPTWHECTFIHVILQNHIVYMLLLFNAHGCPSLSWAFLSIIYKHAENSISEVSQKHTFFNFSKVHVFFNLFWFVFLLISSTTSR